MSTLKRKKISDLQKLAEEKKSIAAKSGDVLKQYLNLDKKDLDEIAKSNSKDFFTAIAFLNAQQKAPKIEQFIREKLQHKYVSPKNNQGDGEKDGKYYEYKISTTNEKEQINALQIRLQHQIDYYLLGYIDEKQFECSRLYLLTKPEIEELCENYSDKTHGSSEDMRSLRVEMKTQNDLLSRLEKEYRAKDLEKIIFN
jgi:hypothetical protein